MAEEQCTKSWNVNAAVWAGCAEAQLLGTAGGGEEVGKRQRGCRKPGRERLTTVRRKREVAKILELSGSKIKLRGRTRRIYIYISIYKALITISTNILWNHSEGWWPEKKLTRKNVTFKLLVFSYEELRFMKTALTAHLATCIV